MKVLDLFSGIGGFSLGLEKAGMETVAFCEMDLYCQKILRKHWPHVQIHDDIKKLDGTQYAGAVDLVCGGFPCQPFSTAGKQKGEDDNRHLWPEMLRVIQESKPAWVIGENVPGIINMALEQVCAGLEAEGYEVQPLIIPACAVDAPHKRNRVWIIAYSHKNHESMLAINAQKRLDTDAQHNGRTDSEECGKHAKAICGSKKRQEGTEQFAGVDPSPSMADTTSFGLQGQCEAATCQPEGAEFHSRGRIVGADRSWWPPESGICRMADGISNRVDRLRTLGNSVVSQIPEQLGRMIMLTQGEQDAKTNPNTENNSV